MRKIQEIFRLYHGSGLSQHQIASSLDISSGVVNKYLQLARQMGISWPLPENFNEEAFLQKWRQSHAIDRQPKDYAPVDVIYVHQELKRPHVTLQLLWDEYVKQNEGVRYYSYTQFTRYYKEWKKRQQPSMRQTHKAGDKVFVDYAGDTISILDRATGEIRRAQLFIAVLGASNYTFAEATWTQTLPDWIGSHVRLFRYFRGVPRLLVPDNLKAGITKACRYEPDINRTYADCIAHYDTAVLPARPAKPKDKAKVEGCVLLAYRWILARFRHRQFESLHELNQEIKRLLEDFNNRAFKKLPGSRKSQFEALDSPALKPLPQQDYEYAEFKIARVNLDYHIEVEKHYYSVPYLLIREEVDVRLTERMIEVFHKNKRVAVHRRNHQAGVHTTSAEHMPKAHQAHAGWTPGYFLNRAIQIGPKTRDIVQAIIEHKKHPEQSYRACLGLLRLEKRFSKERLEKACEYALHINAPRRRSVLSILEKGLDQQPLLRESALTQQTLPFHENIRGANYYVHPMNAPSHSSCPEGNISC